MARRRTELEAPVMVSIFEHLLADHRRIRQTLVQLRAVMLDGDPQEHLHRLLRQYTAHARAEEQVFYSYLIHAKGLQQRALRGIEDHLRLESLLREIEPIARDDPRWNTILVSLCEALEQHLRDEERNMFSLARSALSDREAAELGARFVAERARLRRDLGALGGPAARAAAAGR
ncbi:hemerythrin domain-containing protein [Nannocystis pusilla]|uniref:Hemerythrin domain-containing protein n=1 Tax=Nannocystis pusilla TaxID=889268 RepID=A0ABS7TM93_9BACT|nr:hemerythrin domain-containing protein [Nannocystis pusilla]